MLKPGRLTKDELDVMRKHCQIGANLLAGGRSRVLQLAETIALSHHERWDGNGYPHGIAGDEIPFEARVVAIADVFDALTHQRSYKSSWSVEKALGEISRQRGKQFDPNVTDVFLELADAGVIIDVQRPQEAENAEPIRRKFYTLVPFGSD